MPFWTFCKSLLKIQHLFSLLGNQSLLFFGCAVQKNIQQIFDVAFSLQGFHEQRMPFVLWLLRCVLPFPCSQVMEVIGQRFIAPVFLLSASLFWGWRSDMGLDSALLVVMKQADCHTITDSPNAVHLCYLSYDQVLLNRIHCILLTCKQNRHLPFPVQKQQVPLVRFICTYKKPAF